MLYWLLLLIAIICETFATAFLKLAEGFSKPLPSAGVIIGYLLSFYCFSLAIKVIPVGVAYAVWSGIGMALIVLIGWVWFGQKLDPAALIGISLILVGLLVIHSFSRSIDY